MVMLLIVIIIALILWATLHSWASAVAEVPPCFRCSMQEPSYR